MLKTDSPSLGRFEALQPGFYISLSAPTHMCLCLMDFALENALVDTRPFLASRIGLPSLDYSTGSWKDPSSHSQHSPRVAERAAAWKTIDQLGL